MLTLKVCKKLAEQSKHSSGLDHWYATYELASTFIRDTVSAMTQFGTSDTGTWSRMGLCEAFPATWA